MWKNYQVLPYIAVMAFGVFYFLFTMDYTIHAALLSFISAILSIFTSIFIVPYLVKRDPHSNKVPGGLSGYIGTAYIGLIMLFVGLACMLNSHFSVSEPIQVKSVIFDKKQQKSKYGTKWILKVELQSYGKLDLRVSQDEWKGLKYNEEINVVIVKGLLGFYRLESFEIDELLEKVSEL